MSDHKNSIRRYQVEAHKTAAYDEDAIRDRLADMPIGLLHSLWGLQDELGELSNQLKGHVFYGRQLDVTNLIEELGDLAWFWSEALTSIDVDAADCLGKNIEKLRKRFGDKFTEEKANNRDLESERQVLEGANRPDHSG